MKIKILILFVCFFLFLPIFAFELNESEQKWLNERKVFKILVTDNNYPYEYINEKGQIDGINIDIYKEIFRRMDRKLLFTVESDNIYDIDASSSFVENYKFQELSTTVPYTIKYYILSMNLNTDLNTVQNVYMINQDLTKKIMPELASKSLFIYSDVKLAYNEFIKDDSAILLTDNLHMSQVDYLVKRSDKAFSTKKIEVELEAKLWLKNEDKMFYMILSKVLNEMLYQNKVTDIILDWEKKLNQKFMFETYYRHSLIIFSVFIILFVSIVILIIKFNIIKKGLINTAYQAINRNKELMVKNQELYGIIAQMEQQSVSVLDNLNNIAMTIDLKGLIKYVNKSVHDVLGYNPNTLTGTNIGELISQEDKVKLLSLNQKAFQKVKNEIVIKSIEGFNKTFIYTTNFVKSADGNTRINCILQDISERIALDNRLEAYTTHLEDLVKQRTSVLKQSEERFRFIVEHAYDSIILMQNFNIQLGNQAFYHISGLNKDDILDKNYSFLNIIPEKNQLDFMTKFNQAKENNEESFIITHPILIENQKEIEVETHFTSINYSDKILDLAIMHDIEEKKIREREKIEHEKFLTVSSFAITANDKINSPLNAILGYTELLDIQLTDKNKTQINAFRNIYDSISIIQKILRRLKSLTNVTLKSYNLEDFKMLKIEDEDDES